MASRFVLVLRCWPSEKRRWSGAHLSLSAALNIGDDTVSGETPPEDDSLRRKPPVSVLLIEDEALVRMVIGDELRDLNYRVVEAASAEEARQIMLADEPISLVITDINLPATSGLDFSAWVRREFPDVKIVLISGRHEYAVAAKALGRLLA